MSKITKQQVLDATFKPAVYSFRAPLIQYYLAQPEPGMCNFPKVSAVILDTDAIEGLHIVHDVASGQFSVSLPIFETEESEEPISADDLSDVVKHVLEKVK